MSPTYSVCKNHGYIAGEKYECPVCSAKTEVYSRITGYYRPVQNWNDGKTQEFKDRLTYNIETSVLRRSGCPCDANEADDAVIGAEITDAPVLFATKTCPKCRVAASLLQNAGIDFTKVFVEDNEEWARAIGLRQAPTLVVGDKKYAEIEGVREYINETAKIR